MDTHGVDPHGELDVCRRFGPRIRAYGLRHLRDGSAADDLVQHVLVVVLRALREGRIENLERIDAYVLGTCRNAVMDFRRGTTRRQRAEDEASALLPESYTPAWSSPDRKRLEHCLGALPPRDRAVVLATFVEDRDADEIGASMGLTAGNVRVIRHRAIERLQGCVGGAS